VHRRRRVDHRRFHTRQSKNGRYVRDVLEQHVPELLVHHRVDEHVESGAQHGERDAERVDVVVERGRVDAGHDRVERVAEREGAEHEVADDDDHHLFDQLHLTLLFAALDFRIFKYLVAVIGYNI